MVYDIVAAAQVAGTLKNSPSWTGAGAGAWNKCSYDGSVTLVSGKKYQACVFADGALVANWFSAYRGLLDGRRRRLGAHERPPVGAE